MSNTKQATDRFTVRPAVFAVLLNDNKTKVLLQRRAGTGYMDSYYDFPSGHVETGETLQEGIARETLEEVGLEIKPDDLTLIHVNQNAANEIVQYINFIFKATAWSGEPRLCEPEKCDDVAFFDLTVLPKITPQVRRALENLDSSQVTFSYFVPKDFEEV